MTDEQKAAINFLGDAGEAFRELGDALTNLGEVCAIVAEQVVSVFRSLRRCFYRSPLSDLVNLAKGDEDSLRFIDWIADHVPRRWAYIDLEGL